MRLLYISHTTDKNGSSVALLNLVVQVKERNHVVAVTVPKLEGFLVEELKRLDIPIMFLRGYPEIMQAPIAYGKVDSLRKIISYSKIILGVHRGIYSIIKEFRPDIVHTNTSAIDFALLGCWLTNTPHVWHIRELLDKGCNIKVFPSLGCLKRKFRLPFNYNIAITNAVFEHYALRKKDVVIYDGVIKDNIKIYSSNDFSFPFILSVGYIQEAKGTKQLIEQFGKFAEINKDCHLLLVGKYCEHDSYYKECIVTAEKMKCIGRVHFLGQRDDVYSLMSSAKALVVASKYEGFGFTSVEAMYCGTPVIGRNVGGIKEQFDNGLAQMGEEIGLRYNDYVEIPALLNKVMTNNLEKMTERAKYVVISNYTVCKYADAVLAYYEKIIKKRQACSFLKRMMIG